MLPGNGNKLQTETEPTPASSARIGSVGYNLNSCRIFHYYLGVFCVRNVMQNINYGYMAMATNAAQVEIAARLMPVQRWERKDRCKSLCSFMQFPSRSIILAFVAANNL